MKSREFLRYYALGRWGHRTDDYLAQASVIGHGFPIKNDAA